MVAISLNVSQHTIRATCRCVWVSSVQSDIDSWVSESVRCTSLEFFRLADKKSLLSIGRCCLGLALLGIPQSIRDRRIYGSTQFPNAVNFFMGDTFVP
jgi:hypothetical protein